MGKNYIHDYLKLFIGSVPNFVHHFTDTVRQKIRLPFGSLLMIDRKERHSLFNLMDK